MFVNMRCRVYSLYTNFVNPQKPQRPTFRPEPSTRGEGGGLTSGATLKSEMVEGEWKKTRKFWDPTLRGPTHRPLLPPSGPPPFGAPKGVCSSMLYFHLVLPLFFEKEGQQTKTPILAKVGQIRMAKVGLAKVGISRQPAVRVGFWEHKWAVQCNPGPAPSDDLWKDVV